MLAAYEQTQTEQRHPGTQQAAGICFSPVNFERKEKKYLISDAQYTQLMSRIGRLLEYDAYANSLISSLYYDTPQDLLINRSLEKPLYKEKIRLRSYGASHPGSTVYVELKKKFKGIVYKRRMPMSIEGAYAFMDGMEYEVAARRFPLEDKALQAQAFEFKTRQIASEIAFTKQRLCNLEPAMMIVTNRLALRGVQDKSLRITFDIDPVWRTDQLYFEDGFDGDELLKPGQIIMEIKCLGAYPLWLGKALGECRIYPQSCSKYGIAYGKAHPRKAVQANCIPLAYKQVVRNQERLPISQVFSLQTARSN